MYEKEKLIQEQRTIEATKKNLMGNSGKLVTIARYLGQPMVFTEMDLFNNSYYNYEEDEDKIPTVLENEDLLHDYNENDEMWNDSRKKINLIRTNVIGYFFTGLSKGVNMEIKYLGDDNEIYLEYKGNVVYQEKNGELIIYNPTDGWETFIDKFYIQASTIRQKRNKELKEEKSQELEQKKQSFLGNLLKKWGI